MHNKRTPQRAALPADSSELVEAERSAAVAAYGLTISRIVSREILPHVEKEGTGRVLLAGPHVEKSDLPAGITVSRRGPVGRAVRRRGHITNVIARYPDDAMEALRFPCFCFVYGGEADIPVGDAIVHCRAGHAILIPPGMPLTAGHGPHWCRPNADKAYSDILWMHLLPFGAQCHLCHTRGAEHRSDSMNRQYAVANRQLFTLAEQMIQELSEDRPYSTEIASLCFSMLLHLFLRSGGQDSQKTAPEPAPPESARRDQGDPLMIVQRAQQHIKSNLGKPLSLESIARAAYVSRARLTSLFRSQLNQTVWEYVTECRIREAKTMLSETNIYVYDIARLCGFSHQSHFFVRFAEATGMAPGEYRNQTKRQAPEGEQSVS